MADGLVILVDDVNLNEVSPLVREGLGFGGRRRRRAYLIYGIKQAGSSDINT